MDLVVTMESDATAALIKHSDSSAAVQDDKGSTSNPSVTLDGLLTRKWLVMGLVAALSFGSDFSGYFISASVDTCEGHLPGLAAGYSISLFLGGNVLSSVFVANLFERLGIQSSLTFASLLLFVGNGLKSGIPFLNNELDPSPASMIYAGSFICGLSQPIFRVCDLEVISFWPERQEYLSAISSAGLFGVSFAYLMNSLDCYQIFSIATLGAAALLLAVVTILPQPVAISAVPCSSHSHQRTRRAGGPARAFRALLPRGGRGGGGGGGLPAATALACLAAAAAASAALAAAGAGLGGLYLALGAPGNGFGDSALAGAGTFAAAATAAPLASMAAANLVQSAQTRYLFMQVMSIAACGSFFRFVMFIPDSNFAGMTISLIVMGAVMGASTALTRTFLWAAGASWDDHDGRRGARAGQLLVERGAALICVQALFWAEGGTQWKHDGMAGYAVVGALTVAAALALATGAGGARAADNQAGFRAYFGAQVRKRRSSGGASSSSPTGAGAEERRRLLVPAAAAKQHRPRHRSRGSPKPGPRGARLESILETHEEEDEEGVENNRDEESW